MSERRNLLTAILEYCAAALLAAASMLICLQVFYGTSLRRRLPASEEILRFLFVWLSFLGATVVFRRGGHFRLDFLVHKIVAPQNGKTNIHRG